MLIERLERTKVLLYQESLASIAADGIVLIKPPLRYPNASWDLGPDPF